MSTKANRAMFESIGFCVTMIVQAREKEDWKLARAYQDKLERDHGFRLTFTDTRDPKERDALGGGWGAPMAREETGGMMDGAQRQKLDEQSAAKLREIARTMDEETGHFAADQVLLDLLAEAGFPETIETFEAVEKWYA